MPVDPKSTTSSESNKPRGQGWLAKCGLVIPALSVRGRDAPDGDPNKLVMYPADSKEKKRKRTSKSPMPASRTAVRMQEKRDVEIEQSEAKDAFDLALQPSEVHARYTSNRAQLLHDENAISWDLSARQSASPLERRAALIVRVLREYERAVLFGNIPSEKIPGPETLDMGGQFLTNKHRIEKRSKIFEISKQVPKGALLHLHFNAELHPERLLEEARSMPNMFIRSIRPLLKPEDLELTEMVFNVMPDDTYEADIFSPQYEGEGENFRDPKILPRLWMRWTTFQSEFLRHFPGLYVQKRAATLNSTVPNSSEQAKVKLEPAENWIKKKMVLSEEEAYALSQTVNGVWARFNQATRCFKGLLNYEKVYKWYISSAIDRMIEEKVMYAELRPMLLDKFIPSTDGRAKIDNAAQMQMIIDGVKAKKDQLESQGMGHLFPFGLKIVYCTPRSIPKFMMRNEMKHCIDLKIQFPDLICGFDLVGAEDRPNHIGFYYEELVALKKTCEEKGLDLPFMFHAGETLLDTGGSTEPGNSNLYDSVLLESKRIGHGFSLMKHPHLIERFRKTETSKGICVELCPISNELLHLCRNVKEHPYTELLAAGIPCTINSDNPSLFSNSMSHEFYQVMVGSPAISIHSWKQLALWSLEYSCLSESDKAKGYEIFNKAWEDFCYWVVETYDGLFDGDSLNEARTAEAFRPHEEA
ncbi:Metallo-dependent hydrolase [Amniculicola lignicola CBS 123094]|uniref:Metallo-dependent hydrolase n=1 Tax=Amniculicola lignicola CBS 123094 TaxID=1392246 RepID=A0A6A5WFV9_9PLEO|nr:Metallo-dependent hydrolase [Amniculicola lignicola CBS 123094]